MRLCAPSNPAGIVGASIGMPDIHSGYGGGGGMGVAGCCCCRPPHHTGWNAVAPCLHLLVLLLLLRAGFAIGNVAAFDMDGEGVVSPGGVGFDINCGACSAVAHRRALGHCPGAPAARWPCLQACACCGPTCMSAT